MSGIIDLNKPVYDLVKEYPEAASIMMDLGFENITNPAMLNTVGRVITLKKGAAMKNVSMETIKETFSSRGFEIIE